MIDDQVARLHVAVDDTVAVRVVEALASLGGDIDRLIDLQPLAGPQEVGDARALDVLHHDVMAT